MDGVRMTRILLIGALERHGLTEIPAQGLPFDPLRHEAVSMEPAGEVPEGHVVRVLQTGYQIGDHVVRHSRVVVASPAV
jgi:molecular chaperone GrpE